MQSAVWLRPVPGVLNFPGIWKPLITSGDKLIFYDVFGEFQPPRIGLRYFPLDFSLSACIFSFLLVFCLCSLAFTCVLLVFTCAHLCSTCVHLCSLVFTCVPLVFYLCSFVFHLCSFAFTYVHLCSYLCGVLD